MSIKSLRSQNRRWSDYSLTASTPVSDLRSVYLAHHSASHRLSNALRQQWRSRLKPVQVGLHAVPAQQIVLCEVRRIELAGNIDVTVVEHDGYTGWELRNDVSGINDSPRINRELVE